MPHALRAPFSVTMDPASGLRQRPTLAAAIGVITGIYANIEHELGLIMASILGTDAALGIAIYLNLRAEKARHEVLRAAAESRLSTEHAAKIVGFWASLRDRSKERNNIVHGLWGFSDEHPKHLVLLSQRGSMRARAQDKRWVGTNITIKSSDVMAMTDKPRFMLYGERDFTDISNRLEECLKEALWLQAEIALDASTSATSSIPTKP
jgi:hypothetical protein